CGTDDAQLRKQAQLLEDELNEFNATRPSRMRTPCDSRLVNCLRNQESHRSNKCAGKSVRGIVIASDYCSHSHTRRGNDERESAAWPMAAYGQADSSDRGNVPAWKDA